ncbi:MAG: helix-turn-helix transcriptional regulator, partial [Lachnospiraceae bacterium]|nr:helix-turn-helix transcriptional regulator [Lachnospiraceae bacterium]
AAIRGGVPYEVSFSLSDRFIREVEKQTDPVRAEELFRSAEVSYARTVRDYQRTTRTSRSEHTNYHIEKCKEYIFRHLHGRIRVPEIASALALNANYLSTFFRKSEGITITEYILRQKLVLVRNMLIYSDYTYLEITNYLGFPSQSYLGKKFKAETGMTLREYRTRYRAHDFIQSADAEEFLEKADAVSIEESAV